MFYQFGGRCHCMFSQHHLQMWGTSSILYQKKLGGIKPLCTLGLKAQVVKLDRHLTETFKFPHRCMVQGLLLPLPLTCRQKSLHHPSMRKFEEAQSGLGEGYL